MTATGRAVHLCDIYMHLVREKGPNVYMKLILDIKIGLFSIKIYICVTVCTVETLSGGTQRGYLELKCL